MLKIDFQQLKQTAATAALEAGQLLRKHLGSTKSVRQATRHDIRLELDLQLQRRIRRRLKGQFPSISFLGEEEPPEREAGQLRWVVDPIDGTVNYAYGIPHACVSIALQAQVNTCQLQRSQLRPALQTPDGYQTVLGVIYDPFCDELWTADLLHRTRLNGDPVRVKQRPLEESIVCLGFGKSEAVLRYLEAALHLLSSRVRKIRIMGSAALALAYVATGRFDIYLEPALQLWDVAAGSIIVEQAGGVFQSTTTGHTYSIFAHNGYAGKQLQELLPPGLDLAMPSAITPA